MINTPDPLIKDFEAVKQIPIVPTMLEVVCQTTGMGFAAIARVTEARWIACCVRDEVAFGLEEGGELAIETTICNEIRDSRQPVIIENVEDDPAYSNHHTPKIYGLQSYISYPIILKNGFFFGTLCAISAKPAKLKETRVTGMFSMFSDLLSFHLQSQDLLERSYRANFQLHNKNKALAQVNNELDTFVYTASHDLKSPVSNVEGLVNALSGIVANEEIDKEKARQVVGLMKASLRRLRATIKDLTTIVEADQQSDGQNAEALNLPDMVELVKQDLNTQIAASGATIEVNCQEGLLINFSRKNFKSIIYNLLSNAIKYCSPYRCPQVLVKLFKEEGKIKLSVTDNGTGIPADKQDQVFTLFNRFHDQVEGSGVGLYLVKRMVENRNGHIQVESTPDEGTTFTITF